jgi:amino acid adenylation domain-containing protein
METAPTAGFWLSPQQKHVWTLQQEGKALRSVCLLKIDCEIEEAMLSAALHHLTARHETLRTVYVRQAGMKFPFQAVLDAAKPAFKVIDLGAMAAAEQVSRLNEIFDSERVVSTGPEQPPIAAVQLAHLGNGRSAILLSVPAMTADAASLDILARELMQLVTGGPTVGSDDPLRYVQFAQWQDELLEDTEQNSAKGRDFWNGRLEGAAAPPLPHEIKHTGTFSPQVLTLRLDGQIAEKIDTLAALLKTSRSNTLLAAWQSVLWKLTGQARFQTGVLFDFREHEELRGIVGLIAKSIPIEARFDGDPRFREVVEHVHAAVVQAADWQEFYIPGTGFGSEPAIGFEYRSTVQMQRMAVFNGATKLKMCVARNASGLAMEFQYDEARLTSATVGRIAAYFMKVLEAALTEPEIRVSQIQLLDDAERRQLLVEWNQTTEEYPRSKCYHELFESQVVATPDRPALRCNDSLLSYRELNDRANQLAQYLRGLGVGPDSLVGLCVERSAEMMVAVLGILKAGGAYVPLNPDNPKPRTVQQLVGALLLITEKSLLEHLPAFPGRTLCLDRDASLWADQPSSNPANHTTPENLVYVIYTSGSTGVPKGVAVRHRNLVNYSCFIAKRLQLAEFPEGLNFATVSTIGADLGNTCIYPALISGGCVHIVGYEVSTDAQRTAEYSSQYSLDVLKIVPSHLQALLDSPQAARVLPRKYLVLGGETFTSTLAEKIFSLGGTCEVFNHYGPTETTVGSLTLRLADYGWKKSGAASIPIGRPIANTQIYILDGMLQPVPAGVVGELYIAGDGVTAGYLNQSELTDERFIRNPFADEMNSRMYRTGDLARYLPDGNVEFLGRSDDQVKIRGFRIELGEIESVLASRPGVKQAVVVAKDDIHGNKRLFAFVVTDQASGISLDELQSHLKEQLPEFMLPAAIVPLAKIPLTPNGKVDRQALPEPETVQPKVYVAPSNAAEEGVARIWEQVLHRERIGSDENFFELGGHSLLATQVISRVREQFRVELPIRAMFDHPTIAGLAEAVQVANQSPPQPIAPPIAKVSRAAYRAKRS